MNAFLVKHCKHPKNCMILLFSITTVRQNCISFLTGLLDIPYNGYCQDFAPIRAAPIGAKSW